MDVSFTWMMGMRPIAERFLGAATALVLGFFGTRREAQAAIAALAIAVIAVERQLNPARVEVRIQHDPF